MIMQHKMQKMLLMVPLELWIIFKEKMIFFWQVMADDNAIIIAQLSFA